MLWKRGCVLCLQVCGLGLGGSGLVNITASGDEIANVNFLYDDIVNVLQNTIRSGETQVYQIQ